jgi:hypothetical protein
MFIYSVFLQLERWPVFSKTSEFLDENEAKIIWHCERKREFEKRTRAPGRSLLPRYNPIRSGFARQDGLSPQSLGNP